MATFRAPRGTRDLLPAERAAMLRLEAIGAGLATRYGYRPIETPLFEQAAVFERGVAEVTHDAEIIELANRFYADAGLTGVLLRLNSIGDPVCRPAYLETLAAYYRSHAAALPGLEADRLERNPLRLLDSKDPAMAAINAAAPA